MFRRKYGTALCALVLIALPALLNDPFITHLGVRAATYAIVVMGLTLFAGYTGQISLGHAAFFGLAAYLSGMMAKAGVPYLVSVPVATAAVGVLGCLVGMLVLRTSGPTWRWPASPSRSSCRSSSRTARSPAALPG